MSIMEKNIYLIDSRSTKQQAVIGNFVKTSIFNDIVKKTYNLWNNLKTACLNSNLKTAYLNSDMKTVYLNSYMKKVCLNSDMKKVYHPVEWLRTYYSNVLERQLTVRQTWLLINAQLAFAAAFFPVDAPWFVRIVCLAWVVSALLKCREGI